ncbi:MAG: urea amidolyase, partial [Chloroflexales bacterium]|nr:urea amidolyase [Chloroflexales bacterium]
MTRPIFNVIASGPLTTVQDGGRPAARRYGVPEGGAMDEFALRAANKLVGNAPLAAALEVTLGGLALAVLAPCVVAITGATLDLRCDGRALPLWTACVLRQGERLELGQRQAGARAYLALEGGIATAMVLGGSGTDLGGGFGGIAGRALRAQDVIYSNGPTIARGNPAAGMWLPPARRPAYCAAPRLRVIAGPHA